MRYGVRFHVNMERSRFPRRNRVDYKALNVLSTVDLEVHLKGRRKFKSGSKVYFVERLISRRRLKNEDFEYLVKWKDWPLWTSTWEPSAHLNEHLIRAYSNPTVTVERLQSASVAFLEGILSILKSNAISSKLDTGCILPELFEILERIAVLYKKEEIQ